MRKQTRVTVFDQERYDGEWPPTKATEYVTWFAGKLDTIPAEYRATAEIELDSEHGHEGECYVRIVIFYTRPETDDEMNARAANERRLQAQATAQELQMLAVLKAKYES